MDNILKTILYIDIILVIFVISYVLISRTLTKPDVDLLANSPAVDYNTHVDGKLKMSDLYGNLCGDRADINSEYLSDNYLTITDSNLPITPDDRRGNVFYNGHYVDLTTGATIQLPKNVDMNADDRGYEVLTEFNDLDASPCRRCYGVNGIDDPVLVAGMKRCRGSSENACRIACVERGDKCLGYVLLEKRFMLPHANFPPDIPTFVSNHQRCEKSNFPSLLGPIHDIQCGLITSDSIQKNSKRCTYDGNIINRRCTNDSECESGGKCLPDPQSSFDLYKTVEYSCDHGSGSGLWNKNINVYEGSPPAKAGQYPDKNYIVQQNNLLNPGITTLSTTDASGLEQATFSARGLIRNSARDDGGWALPNLPIPVQDQWYVPCLASTNVTGHISPIDIGTANYKVANDPDSLLETSNITITRERPDGTCYPVYPQAVAQMKCEEKCLTQDLTRESGIPTQGSSPKNYNYECGAYTVEQTSTAYPATGNPCGELTFKCNLYKPNCKATIPYKFASGPSTQCPSGSAGTPSSCSVPIGPDIVANLCANNVLGTVNDKAVESATLSNYFPDPEPGDKTYTGTWDYNKNIAEMIRGGVTKDSTITNEYIWEQFNPQGKFQNCLNTMSTPNRICDTGVPFGKVRTNSPPPKFIDSGVAGVPPGSNLWYPWAVP